MPPKTRPNSDSAFDYEIYEVDPDGYGTRIALAMHPHDAQVIRQAFADRTSYTTTVSVEVWNDGERIPDIDPDNWDE